MHRIVAVMGVVLVASLAHPRASSAQDLADGAWSGTVSPPSGGEVAVEYLVTHPDGTLTIEMLSPMGQMPLSDIAFQDGALLFTWQPGPQVECRLEPEEDDGYSGECVDDTGGVGQMRMAPPIAGN